MAFLAFAENAHGERQPLMGADARWEPTQSGNIQALNETADFYRFFDAPPDAEFLRRCVERTIEIDLPAEATFLRAYDFFRREVANIIDMPDRAADLLFRFLR